MYFDEENFHRMCSFPRRADNSYVGNAIIIGTAFIYGMLLYRKCHHIGMRLWMIDIIIIALMDEMLAYMNAII